MRSALNCVLPWSLLLKETKLRYQFQQVASYHVAGETRPPAQTGKMPVPQPCEARLSILYLEHAISAKEDGGHYAHDNCCAQNKTRPRSREGFSAAPRH